jgi:hypothetical protein
MQRGVLIFGIQLLALQKKCSAGLIAPAPRRAVIYRDVSGSIPSADSVLSSKERWVTSCINHDFRTNPLYVRFIGSNGLSTNAAPLGTAYGATSRRSVGVHRQGELKRGTMGYSCRGPQPATVSFHDRAADRKSHPHAAGFGGEEGVEQPVRILGRDPDAAIRHTHEHLLCHRAPRHGRRNRVTQGTSPDHQ